MCLQEIDAAAATTPMAATHMPPRLETDERSPSPQRISHNFSPARRKRLGQKLSSWTSEATTASTSTPSEASTASLRKSLSFGDVLKIDYELMSPVSPSPVFFPDITSDPATPRSPSPPSSPGCSPTLQTVMQNHDRRRCRRAVTANLGINTECTTVPKVLNSSLWQRRKSLQITRGSVTPSNDSRVEHHISLSREAASGVNCLNTADAGAFAVVAPVC